MNHSFGYIELSTPTTTTTTSNASSYNSLLINASPTSLNSTEITFSVNFMCVILIAMDVLTLIGNSTVILAILTVPRLQTITNYFILSLGFADFLVGLFVLPAAISLHMTEGVWLLGWILCDAWISLDILLCTASILSLCAISIDRYLAISQPFRYSKRRRTKGLVFKIIAAVWILSAVITCPPMLGWSEPGRHGPNLTECHYNEKPGYIVYSACGTFYVPLIVILYTYGRIVVVVKERTKYFEDKQIETRTVSHQTPKDKNVPSTPKDSSKGLKLSEVIVSPYLKVHFIDLSYSNEGSSSSNGSVHTSSIESKRNNNFLQPPPLNEHQLVNRCSNCGVSCPSRLHISYVNEEDQKKPGGGLNLSSFRRSLRRGVKNNVSNNSTTNSFNHHLREAKTAKRLAVVVGFFITCWLPFFIVYVLTAFIPKSVFPPTLIDGFTWLGWVNSTLNPILYAAANPAFRKTFDSFCKRKNRGSVSHL